MQYYKQLIFCVSALFVNLCTVPVLLNHLSLHQKLKLKLIRPDVISVSMPLPEAVPDAQETFERLTDSFEKQYPEFGIELKLCEDLSDLPENSDLYINYQPEMKTADLSEIFRELPEERYLISLDGHSDAVPLSFSVPALYYDMADMNLFQKFSGIKILNPEGLPEDTVTETPDFQMFLENPEHPVLFPVSGMRQAEQNPLSSGRIQMIPVLDQNQPEIIQTNLCWLNSQSSKNKQNIAMLWIEYLLSEEAQRILFAEHYGDLPVHKKAFDTAVNQHQGYYPLKEIRPILEDSDYES